MTLKTRTLGAQGPELTTSGSGLPRSYSWVVGGLAGCVSTLASTLLRRRAGSVEVCRAMHGVCDIHSEEVA